MHATLDSKGLLCSNLQAQTLKLEAAGLLSAGLVHDFNNLLTVINGYNEMLLNSCELPEKARQCLTLVRDAGERAASLARAMMDLSRRSPQRAPVDVNASVSELAALAQHLLPPDIELSTVLASGLMPAMADRCGILQVLLNLVVNSRDAMPDGGRVAIQTALFDTDSPSAIAQPFLPSGVYILLTVADNGIGMDEVTRQRIFEPFYTTKAPGTGTGLGLPMVQHIVKQNGGFLSIQSAKEEGTTVRIYLPAAPGSTPAADTQASDSVPKGHGETILIVEDDSDLRKLLCDSLEAWGYSVLDAGSAMEAAELAANLDDRLDLLICDVPLPDSADDAVVEALLRSRAGLPVLYISGHPALIAGSQDTGEAVLAKPFSQVEFGERVRSTLDRKKRKRVLFVDDDAQVVMFASEILREAGYDVLVGEDGNVALAIVEREPLDLVITDLVMREREGLETMMTLGKSHPDLPVVAISGAFGGQFLHSASLLGARATLAKPFTADDLLGVVNSVLGD
ncbi:MAG: response regulator [Ignavibacteriota bacterium]